MVCFLNYSVCYAICNYNAANIDVMAGYLLERLNCNLYYTLGKLIFSSHINIFSQITREIRQMQPLVNFFHFDESSKSSQRKLLAFALL